MYSIPTLSGIFEDTILFFVPEEALLVAPCFCAACSWLMFVDIEDSICLRRHKKDAFSCVIHYIT